VKPESLRLVPEEKFLKLQLQFEEQARCMKAIEESHKKE